METLHQLLDYGVYLVDLILHIDVHLNNLVLVLGPWLYLVVFLIVFCETGLVVMPLLPGDSLLFALGAMAAIDGSPLDIGWLFALLVLAAVLGDAVNYQVGRHIGPKIFRSSTGRFLNKKHLIHTQQFYDRHGGKTIILARFAPIIRTFAPFVAGIGQMRYRIFGAYNIVGGLLWVGSFLFAGFWLGNIPQVKSRFHIIIILILVVSVLPGVLQFLRSRRASKGKIAAVRS